MVSLWDRLPVVVRAVVAGTLVAAVGTVPWALLVSQNVKHWPAVPWAVPPTVLYLWLFWRYVRGAGWPRSTSDARRTTCRANPLTTEVWGAALFAGIVGLVALMLFLAVVNRMVRLPSQPTDDLKQVPVLTLALCLLTSAAVAGIVEESAFRGYMQGPIERRHGPVAAILVTGSLFGFAHFTHPEVTVVLIPYYLAVAAIYGGLAYLTNSILPSLVLHAAGNVLSAMGSFLGGRAEWQAPSSPAPLIWESGADASFWISCVASLIVSAAAVRAYVSLARVARSAPRPVTARPARPDTGEIGRERQEPTRRTMQVLLERFARLLSRLDRTAARRQDEREAVLSIPFPRPWTTTLEVRCEHYRRLPAAYRDRFRKQVKVFLAEKRITGVEMEVPEETRLLVAASAISLTAGWPGYTWDPLTEVLLYPDDFDRDYKFGGNEASGMTHPWGIVILSVPTLNRSFDRSTEGHHVGFHEFAHLLDLAQGRFDGIPSYLDDAATRHWLQIVRQEESRVREGDSILDAYALSSPVEFFATAVEGFFQIPVEMAARHEELYTFLSTYFRQDPASWTRPSPSTSGPRPSGR